MLIKEIGRFIYRAHIAQDWYLNFADAPAAVYPGGMQVYRFGRAIDDTKMRDFGRWLINRGNLTRDALGRGRSGRPGNLQRLLPAVMEIGSVSTENASAPYPRDVWLSDIQVMVARDHEGSDSGIFVGAKGGNNGESHNHNDVGTFVVYVDGKPVIVDAGVETYTRKTFSDRRYEIWTMQSGYHTLLPTIDGVMQAPGLDYAAESVFQRASERSADLRLDIAGAYPKSAKIKSWVRTVRLNRGRNVEVIDEYQLSDPVETIELALVTPADVNLSVAGRIEFNNRDLPASRVSGSGSLAYNAELFAVEQETISIADDRMAPVWGTRMARVLLRCRRPAQEGQWSFEFTPRA
jgi:hypothetical protein